MFDEKSDLPPPTGKGLVDNITRFSHLLRDNGISVPPPAVIDTLQGLPLIDISNPHTFKCLLQANLICRRQDVAEFNRLFHAYWSLNDRGIPKILFEDNKLSEEEQKDTVSSNTANMADKRSPEELEPTRARQWAIRYSPDSRPTIVNKEELRVVESRALFETILKLLQPLNTRLSRRFKYTVRGKELSLRRLLRRNMQFGGELIFLDFKKKKVKKRRVVFFCDVSGSMDIYTRMILQFIHALNQIDRRTEIFFFSTDLSRGTSQFDSKNFASAISRIPDLNSNWGGGTRIGHCLRIFNENYGRRMLSNKDIVIIFSDGWDRGEIEVLETQMAILKRKAYKIIWLNPLSGTKDYQPLCQGMSTALPYVDSFLPMDGPQSLQLLGRTLEKMIA